MSLTCEEELAHLRFVNANQAAKIAWLKAALANEQRGHRVMRDLWEREVPPGWRCWRVQRRSEAAR